MQTDNTGIDSLALNWREQRTAAGLTLRAAARRASIDPAHLSRVERGRAQLSIQAAFRLAQVLGLKQLAEVLGALLGTQS